MPPYKNESYWNCLYDILLFLTGFSQIFLRWTVRGGRRRAAFLVACCYIWYNKCMDTVSVYRKAVDFLINVCLSEWDSISAVKGNLLQQQYVETIALLGKNVTRSKSHVNLGLDVEDYYKIKDNNNMSESNEFR